MTISEASVRSVDVRSLRPASSIGELRVANQGAPSAIRRAAQLKRILHGLTLVGVVGILTLLVLGIASGVLTSVSSLRSFVGGYGVLAPIAFVIAGALESVVPIIPGSGSIISAPIIFGLLEGAIYAYLATVVGSILVFAISRILGRDLLLARFSKRSIARYSKWMEHPKFARYFAIAIAFPLAPDDLLCYLAGLSGMKWRTYLLIIVLCKPWGVLLYTTGVMALLKAVFPWLGL